MLTVIYGPVVVLVVVIMLYLLLSMVQWLAWWLLLCFTYCYIWSSGWPGGCYYVLLTVISGPVVDQVVVIMIYLLLSMAQWLAWPGGS